MDSLTHIAIGACIGEAMLGKKLGKKAMLWGALANSLPDIDFVAGFWMPTAEELLAHRGFTHSLLFGLIATPALALAADRLHRPHNIRMAQWLLFFGVAVGLHLFMDAFNNYGIGWFEPFNHERISFNAVYVADPFFSFIPALACGAIWWSKKPAAKRKMWWMMGLLMPALYLVYCSFNKWTIDSTVKKAFVQQHIPHQRYFTTPAPLNNWLWFVVAGNDSGYHVGFRSLFDKTDSIHFEYFPRNQHLLDTIADHTDVQQLIRFSQEFYTVEQWNDSLVFNDLRFGQMLGWQNPRGRFVFHYFLQHPDDNKVIVQRGRFKGWNWQVAKGLVKRTMGE
ncbi:metal-dependent hydrolase [Phnomibacter ginsenosidimutans]|uniref:Metal-dependent hydrolase n=1 Tax=Phnomibacter ginsenosidimutans TaxID=2676868 RepID=A0A6I6GL72_9BACT|nr:metal-dependent hydrolase [Phnomibacter ginsenosidimutans]QGW29205.1 metal-dependent hydrolase [Phnomibacter ginsenosidimutans]